MRKELYQEMYNLEKSYWWHTGRKNLVLDIIKKHFVLKKGAILDFGCGSGMMLEVLEPYGRVMGVDTSSEAIKFCYLNGINNVKRIRDIQDLNSSSKKFDLITALDVLEHIENEQLVLRTFHNILKKNGKILLTVPAYKFLWTYWDKKAGHKRRYTRLSLKTLLEKNGFKIIKINYFYSFVLPFVMILRIIKSIDPSRRKSSDFVRFPKMINSFIIKISDIERQILKLFRVPFGLSIVCFAEKQTRK